MVETKYTVKQAAWEAAGFDGNPTPQPLMEVNPRSGCMMLAFPHHWWQPDEVELAYVPVTISLGEIPPERDGYVSTEDGRAAVEAAADQIRESEDSRILGMLQSLGFADSEPPTPFASMEDIAKRRFTGEE